MKLFATRKDMVNTIVLVAIIILILVLSLYFIKPILHVFTQTESAKEFILGYGVYGPIVLQGLFLFQTIYAIIPSTPLVIISGYIYGPAIGLLYSMIGTLLGALLAFGLARIIGRAFVEKVVDKRVMQKFDYLNDEDITIPLFVLMLIPNLPHDFFCYMAGLTKIKIRTYLFIVIVARLPATLITVLFGNELAKMNIVLTIIAILISIIITIIFFIYRKHVEDTISHHIKRFQKNKE
jgi:uncharacterized membrane protein YdjX (TVP38/TMEM64 family)